MLRPCTEFGRSWEARLAIQHTVWFACDRELGRVGLDIFSCGLGIVGIDPG
jgi:hypothetical protein